VYPDPTSLGYFLAESGAATKPFAPEELMRQTFQAGGLTYEAAVTHKSVALGGWVRVVSSKDAGKAHVAQDLRAFGPVRLDRGYAETRVALAPRQAGPAASVTDRASLASLTAWLHAAAPVSAVLQRDKDHDVLASLNLAWGLDAAG